jgi:hypothetical protein
MRVVRSRPGASRVGRARTEGRAWVGGARSWRRLGLLSADGGSSTWARVKLIRNRIRFVIVRIVASSSTARRDGLHTTADETIGTRWSELERFLQISLSACDQEGDDPCLHGVPDIHGVRLAVTRPDCRQNQPTPDALASSPSWAMVGSTRAWSHSPPTLEMWIPSAHRTVTPSIFDWK